jgi:uncharacterized protein (DUF427 family)
MEPGPQFAWHQPLPASTRPTNIRIGFFTLTSVDWFMLQIRSATGVHMKAIWNGEVLAQSNNTVVVEGNHYFPPASLNRQFFSDSSTTTVCPCKGTASYHNVEVNGKVNKDAAWLYATPKKCAAANIADHVAFWKGVEMKA